MEQTLQNYTAEYEWYFPYAPRPTDDGRLTLRYQATLTVPQLADEEREQVLALFREWLQKLGQTIEELKGFEVTDQLLWRCLALTYVQIHRAFFDLEHVGFLLMANGVDTQRDVVRLHELLQAFIMLPGVPGMDAYYQLPTHLARPEDGTLDMALGVNGRAVCVVDGWTYQVHWNPILHFGILEITAPELAVTRETTADPTLTKLLASEEERDRALYEPGGEYPPVSKHQRWLPCW